MSSHDEVIERSEKIKDYYFQLLNSSGEEGDIGFTRFRTVYEELMPIQQEKLQEIAGRRFESLMKEGSMISICVSYRNPVMSYINSELKGRVDYDLWNKYALEYDRINQLLNQLSQDIATKFDGIPLTATIGGIINKINHVEDYFGMVISHRVVAENSGIGWRGKNQLVIHDRFSCAIRFATVIAPFLLDCGEKQESKCGTCSACEDVCTFIKNREKLPDYRENCRKYIIHLQSKGIVKDICGKCVKACYQSSTFKDVFSLPA
ncbi:MAG: hypothetical protein ACFFE2_08615 [Candidatus Thorarchaeota archaeon]